MRVLAARRTARRASGKEGKLRVRALDAGALLGVLTAMVVMPGPAATAFCSRLSE